MNGIYGFQVSIFKCVLCTPACVSDRILFFYCTECYYVSIRVRVWLYCAVPLWYRSLPPVTWSTWGPTSKLGREMQKDMRERWKRCRFWQRPGRRRGRKHGVINILKSWSNSSLVEEYKGDSCNVDDGYSTPWKDVKCTKGRTGWKDSPGTYLIKAYHMISFVCVKIHTYECILCVCTLLFVNRRLFLNP